MDLAGISKVCYNIIKFWLISFKKNLAFLTFLVVLKHTKYVGNTFVYAHIHFTWHDYPWLSSSGLPTKVTVTAYRVRSISLHVCHVVSLVSHLSHNAWRLQFSIRVKRLRFVTHVVTSFCCHLLLYPSAITRMDLVSPLLTRRWGGQFSTAFSLTQKLDASVDQLHFPHCWT